MRIWPAVALTTASVMLAASVPALALPTIEASHQRDLPQAGSASVGSPLEALTESADLSGRALNPQVSECADGFALEATEVPKGIKISWDCANPTHTRGIQMRKWGRDGPKIGTSSHWHAEYYGPLPSSKTDQNTDPGERYRYKIILLTADNEVIVSSSEVSARDTRPEPEPQQQPESTEESPLDSSSLPNAGTSPKSFGGHLGTRTFPG